MPSVRYYNQSAPFWDFVANLEEQGNQHPFFGGNNNTNNNNNERGEASNEHTEQSEQQAPWQGFWPFGPMPHRGPHGPHGHHGPRGSHGRHGPPPPPPPPQAGHPEPPHHPDHGHPPPPPPEYEGPSDGESGPSEPRDHHHEHGHGHERQRGHCGGRGRSWGGRGRGGPCGGGGGRRGPAMSGAGGMPFPFAPLAEMFQSQLFGQNNNSADREGNTFHTNDHQEDFKPEVDVFDTTDAYIVHASLPGAKKEDVGVNWDAEKSELSIAGVVYRPGDEDLLKALSLDERKVGAFERKVRLGSRAHPAQVDVDGITAKLEDGVLRIEVPKMDSGFVEIKKVDIE